MPPKKQVALITGVTGQDGAYLAEFLLKKGYEVHGIKRRSSLFNTDRIDHLYQDPHVDNRNFILHYGDLTDSTSLVRIMQKVQPDEVYNLAAQSHVAVSFEEFVEFSAKELGITLAFEGDGEREVGVVVDVQPVHGQMLASCKPGDVVVKVDPRYYRPTEVETLLGDPSKAKAKLGWTPQTTLMEMVGEMVRSDYASAKRDSLVKSAGFQTYDYHE